MKSRAFATSASQWRQARNGVFLGRLAPFQVSGPHDFRRSESIREPEALLLTVASCLLPFTSLSSPGMSTTQTVLEPVPAAPTIKVRPEVEGEADEAKPRLVAPIRLTGLLDNYPHRESTPVIGRAYDFQIADWLKLPKAESDPLFRELAATSAFQTRPRHLRRLTNLQLQSRSVASYSSRPRRSILKR